MRIHGALAASIGELHSRTTVGATRRTDGPVAVPQAYSRAAMDVYTGAGFLPRSGRDIEEFVVTGSRTYFVLRVVPLSSGAGQGFLSLALDRSQTNLALARMDIRALGDCVPPVVEMHCRGASTLPPPGPEPADRPLPRRDPAPPRATVRTLVTPTDASLLHRLLAALRKLD